MAMVTVDLPPYSATDRLDRNHQGLKHLPECRSCASSVYLQMESDVIPARLRHSVSGGCRDQSIPVGPARVFTLIPRDFSPQSLRQLLDHRLAFLLGGFESGG